MFKNIEMLKNFFFNLSPTLSLNKLDRLSLSSSFKVSLIFKGKDNGQPTVLHSGMPEAYSQNDRRG
jgi:hypothetical protein